MKTAQDWFKGLGNRGEYAALPSITIEEIEAIQADAFADRERKGRIAGLEEAGVTIFRLADKLKQEEKAK